MAQETIVLVNPPNEKIVLRDMYSSTISKGLYNWPCTDLLALSGILKGHFNVVLLDANTLGLSIAETIARIAEATPIGVCFSFGASVKDDEYAFLKALKKRLPGVPLAGTGGLLKHSPKAELSKHPEFDACIMNFVTDDIVRYFKGEYNGLNNFVYRDGDEIVTTKLKLPENNFSYPLPAHEALPLGNYRLSHGSRVPLTSILTSYGCPARCSFCVAGSVDYRYRSPENVLEELRYVKTLGVKEIFFRDNTFCAAKLQGTEILQGMIDEGLDLSWVADTRANVVTEDTIDIIKRSGCHALHIGVESSNEEILKRYYKNITIEQIREAFKLCRERGILTVGYFILGLPGESADDVKRTIDFAIELNCDYASFNIPMPIEGTELREEAIKEGWLKAEDALYDGVGTPLLETGLLTSKEITELRDLAYKRFYFRPAYYARSLTRIKNLYQAKMLALEFFSMIKR